jgi:hypothetical protein
VGTPDLRRYIAKRIDDGDTERLKMAEVLGENRQAVVNRRGGDGRRTISRSGIATPVKRPYVVGDSAIPPTTMNIRPPPKSTTPPSTPARTGK